jgi:hypothetical protein
MKRCTNAEPGTYNHECGKLAQWEATKPNGFTTHFCDQCKQTGTEARPYTTWKPYKEPTP